MLINDTVLLAVNVVDDINSKDPLVKTVWSIQEIPDVAVDCAERICPFVPTETLDLDDPSNDRISPFALSGERLICDCVGII
jgi:hypothetical protein